MDIVRDIHKAISTALTRDSTLTAKVNAITDKPNKNEKYPYITIGDFDAKRFDTFSKKGREVYFLITIYSKYNGSREAFDILADVERILDGELTLTDNTFDNLELDNQYSDTDEAPYIIYTRYRIVAQKGK